MSRALLILTTPADRAKASNWIAKAPAGTRVEFKAPKRTLPQNDRLHAMLTELADQLVWHGQKLSVDDWKLVFMDGLNRELRIVPNLDGNGFVNLGRSTSKLGKDEFSELIELVSSFAAKHDVKFSDDAQASSNARQAGADFLPVAAPATNQERR
jgi:hypothetical protein